MDGMAPGHLQGLMAVVREGTDPRRLMRRFERSELTSEALAAVEALPGAQLVERRRSGQASRKLADRPIVYLEVHVDLVERGEAIAPGSSGWLHAPLWGLARSTLPRLEELRVGLVLLKQRLGLCNPSPAELAPYLDVSAQARFASLTLAERHAAYRESRIPLARELTPDTISLLAGLVAETFTTDQEYLHEIHCEAFADAMKRMLRPQILSAVGKEFEMLVGARILLVTWELPASFHVPSLDAPFRTIEEINRLRRDSFGGLPAWGLSKKTQVRRVRSRESQKLSSTQEMRRNSHLYRHDALNVDVRFMISAYLNQLLGSRRLLTSRAIRPAGANADPAIRCCIVGGLTHRPAVRFGGTLEC